MKSVITFNSWRDILVLFVPFWPIKVIFSVQLFLSWWIAFLPWWKTVFPLQVHVQSLSEIFYGSSWLKNSSVQTQLLRKMNPYGPEKYKKNQGIFSGVECYHSLQGQLKNRLLFLFFKEDWVYWCAIFRFILFLFVFLYLHWCSLFYLEREREKYNPLFYTVLGLVVFIPDLPR